MPISITGTGTITGISAGGLPDDCITTAEILDANITSAKLAQPLTVGTAQASTSGTAIDFTGIPSWAKRITVMLNGVSTSGTSTPWLIQIGDSGGIETIGYLASSTRILASTVASVGATSGFNLSVNNAATNVIHGSMTITLIDLSTNSWVASGLFANTVNPESGTVAGSKSLSATLDRVRITTAGGSDTFDAGSINIMYEG
jgi:hypothetical protein